MSLLYGPDDPEAFVTVRRNADDEDDERVAVLSPSDALDLARALIEFAALYTRPQEP